MFAQDPSQPPLFTPIPPSIAVAIAQIMKTVDALPKSGFNDHGKYKFSSTDDVYAALARKMGEVGLFTIVCEQDYEIVRTEKVEKFKGSIVKAADGSPVMATVQWLKVSFQFILATAEHTWTHPNYRRHVMTQYTGPQTFQALQSFAEKSMLRSLFKLPTGDVDLDVMPQAETLEAQVAMNQPRSRKSSAAAKRDGTDKLFNEIISDIKAAISVDHLDHVRNIYADQIADLPIAWSKLVEDEFSSRHEDLSAKEQA